MTMMEIRAKARRLKQRHDLRLIVIDYMQLMTSGKKVESRQLEVSEFSRQIKLLAKELEVPIIALASSTVVPSSGRTSARCSATSRERVARAGRRHGDPAPPRGPLRARVTRPGEADLIVAKHRNGPTRDITVAFQGHYSRFVSTWRH
jgi:replicative DNA helicase